MTSNNHSQKQYKTWSELVSEMPARRRSILNGSTAIPIPTIGKEYIIEINDYNEVLFDKYRNDNKFRTLLVKSVIPWAKEHPSLRGKHFRGIVFNQELRAITKIAKELDATITGVFPRKKDTGKPLAVVPELSET